MFRSVIGIILVTFFCGSAVASDPTPEETARSVLNEQISLLEKIEPTVERIDLARLYVIRNDIQVVLDDIDSNIAGQRMPITLSTMRLMQNLIIKYKFSHVFFGWEEEPSLFSIYTPMTADDLEKLKSSYETLVSIFGFDASPYTTITANTFHQMKKLLDDLEALPIDENFKLSLRNLWPGVGRTIAIAEQGDRPCAFAAASGVVRMVRDMYPMFQTILTADVAFPLVMEFQGLVEFYAEFAQVDRQPETSECR